MSETEQYFDQILEIPAGAFDGNNVGVEVPEVYTLSNIMKYDKEVCAVGVEANTVCVEANTIHNVCQQAMSANVRDPRTTNELLRAILLKVESMERTLERMDRELKKTSFYSAINENKRRRKVMLPLIDVPTINSLPDEVQLPTIESVQHINRLTIAQLRQYLDAYAVPNASLFVAQDLKVLLRDTLGFIETGYRMT